MVPAHWPASPAGVQSPLPAGSLPALPYILCRRWACYPPDTNALLVSSVALQSVCMGAVCHCCVIARLQAGVRPARLPQSFRGAEFSSCGAEESPEEVSGVPTSCRTSHQVHQQMHNRNAIGKWDWDVCSEILEIPGIAYPGENVKRARLLWVEHPPAGPSAQCISVQLCRSIQRPGVPEPSTLKTRHRHRKQSASQLSKSPHPTQATQTRPRQQNAPD